MCTVLVYANKKNLRSKVGTILSLYQLWKSRLVFLFLLNVYKCVQSHIIWQDHDNPAVTCVGLWSAGCLCTCSTFIESLHVESLAIVVAIYIWMNQCNFLFQRISRLPISARMVFIWSIFVGCLHNFGCRSWDLLTGGQIYVSFVSKDREIGNALTPTQMNVLQS